jgi:Flp pilus assembly protein TadG
MSSRTVRTVGRQSGLAAVEFAITLPVLLLLMLGTAELGRMLSQYDTLTKSVRDGCRYVASQTSIVGGTTNVVSITPQFLMPAAAMCRCPPLTRTRR